jgi:hypothetical protein
LNVATEAQPARQFQEGLVMPKDDTDARFVRALCITLASMSWRGAFTPDSLLSLADEFEDYILGRVTEYNDEDLCKRIAGKK